MMNEKLFYNECYLRTGGWLPTMPLAHSVVLGDFFQIQYRRINRLGNIFDLQMAEDLLCSSPLRLNQRDWRFSSGVQQAYCVTETQQGGERTKQVLKFFQPGAFLFYGNNPSCQLILNWSDLMDEITIKLTHSEYSFRDIYVVTAIASMDNSGLAIARKTGAKLTISAQIRETDIFDLFQHQSSIAEQSNDIERLEINNMHPSNFFKAKKLVLSEHKKDQLIRKLITGSNKKSEDTISSWFHANLINYVPSNELNIDTSREFFRWVDVSLDDVDKLFH